jgi:hypothetical protein
MPSSFLRMTFSDPYGLTYVVSILASFGVELLMRVRLGCLSVHEHTTRFARRNINDDDDVQGQVPSLPCFRSN